MIKYGKGTFRNLRYNTETDELERLRYKKWVVVTGCDFSGYRRLGVFHKNYMLHRVIYTIMNGEIADGMHVDHINNIRSDNRLCNLQLLNNRDNVAKQSTGLKPTKVTKSKTWQVSVGVYNNGKTVRKYIGSYRTEALAQEVCTKYDNLFGYKKKYYHLLDISLDAWKEGIEEYLI